MDVPFSNPSENSAVTCRITSLLCFLKNVKVRCFFLQQHKRYGLFLTTQTNPLENSRYILET